jgi:membrane protein
LIFPTYFLLSKYDYYCLELEDFLTIIPGYVMNRKDLFQLFKTSFKDWREDNATMRAAALTFFIILPLPSLLLIVVSIYALFVGQTTATQQVIQQISSLAGPSVAGLFSELLASSSSPFTSVWAALTLVIFSVAGAVGTFAVLRDIMDVIWEVKSLKKPSFTTRVKQRIGPFVLVSALGLIVIAWTGIATILFSVIKLFSINGTLTFLAIEIAQVLLSFVLATLLFALIYKVIPLVRVHWIDVILPAVVTSIAFTVANYVLGIYIQIFTVTTIIGAAGSLIIILLWIFILNQIVLFGAEISKVYASIFGPHPKQHLPGRVEKILETLEEAEEKIEEATGKIVEAPDEIIGKVQAKEVVEKPLDQMKG